MSNRAMAEIGPMLDCDVPPEMPVLPLMSTIVFPLGVTSLQVRVEQSKALLRDYSDPDNLIALVYSPARREQAGAVGRSAGANELRAGAVAGGLSARSAHGVPLAGVEGPELNPGCVDRASHHTPEGVHLARELALAETPDRRVAAHLPEQVGAKAHESRTRSDARRGEGGLDARVATADDEDVAAAVDGDLP